MNLPCIVLLTLGNPRERYWGELIALQPGGVTLRAIELNSLDDFITQVREHRAQDGAGPALPFPTSFFPMHRVERILLDERAGEIPAIAERFRERLGESIEQYLARQG